ncbi:MAG TPA: GNAT family N-acetyltransferase [Phenylobacterium sp.]|jgi:ribosomal protein S18 acetylase RimI-like enzyme
MLHPNPDSPQAGGDPAIREPLLRRTGAADAEALVAVGVATFVETFGHLYPQSDLTRYLAEAYDLARTKADLADPARASWLVEADGEVVGYATAGPCALPHREVTAACGEIKRIYVLKAWQGSGLAARLLGEIMAWLERDGPRDIWLGVWSENARALRFYARHGFAKAGEYDFHVGDTVDREYILRREANSSS